MNRCICSSCKNLKSIINEIDEEINEDVEEVTETCEFGFPSESCSECDEANCTLTCAHYVEDCEEEAFSLCECVTCGKTLKVVASNVEAGPVYCPMCYLNK